MVVKLFHSTCVLYPMRTPCRMSSQLSMHFSSYFTFVYFVFQTLDAVSTNEFILTMHHDNNNRCEKNK